MNYLESESDATLPLITFALFAYNQEQFVAEAVQGALSQTYSPLEIILSDDCSSDATFAKMKQMADVYQGPHQVIVRQNTSNIGWAKHINQVMELVHGELVVVAAGDDVSLPERVSKTYEAYAASGRTAKSIFSNALVVDEMGQGKEMYFPPEAKRPEMLTAEWMAEHMSGVLGCTHAWSPEVFNCFGPLDPGTYQEDLVIPFRASLAGVVVYLDQVLVKYRRHEGNMHLRSAKDKRIKAELHMNLLRQAQNQVVVCNNRICDLETIRVILPERKIHWDKLIYLVSRRKELAHIESQLYEEHGLWQRLRVVFMAWKQHRVPIRVLLRWLLSLLPYVYIGYQKYTRFRTRQGRQLSIKFE